MTNEVLQKIASDEQNISSSNGLEPKLRFKEFDGKWSRNILGNCCDIIMGQSPDSSSYNNNCIGLPLVQGNADMCERIATPQRYTSQPTKICEAGSIILSVRAPVGTVGKTFQKICLGRGVCGITSKNIEFMYQYLLNNENSWRHIEQGGTFTAINSDDIKSFPIILPSLPEQKKIADFLSLIDQRIEKQRRLVESLKKYKRGALSRVFNDVLETVKLSDISNFISSARTLSTTLNGNKGIYPVYDAAGIAGYIDYYDIDSDYITIVKDGSGVGRLQKCDKKSSFIGTLGALVAKNCTTDFLYAVLQTIDFSKFVTGMAIPHIYYRDYKSTLLPFPSEEKQHFISQLLKKFDIYIENETQKLTNMLAYKQGLLQQMFI